MYQLGFGTGFDWRARVTEVVPNEAFELQIIDADADWTGMRVRFEVLPGSPATPVRFRHVGWPSNNGHYRVSRYCWAANLVHAASRLRIAALESSGGLASSTRQDMNHHDVGRFWNANAEAWTKLARAGYDVYRDLLNTPAFMALLPDVAGLAVLDIGCGEGHNTRLLAQRGARLTGIDIAEVFIAHAQAAEESEPLGIVYRLASAVELPFDDASFDATTAFMSLMDIAETDRVLSEAYRVLVPGGFLQFSITHPCFDTPHRRNVRDAAGRKYAVEVGDYFRNLNGEVTEWLFGAAPAVLKHGLPLFRTPRFTRTLSQWVNLLIDTGFIIERTGEPYPSDDAVRAYPRMQGARVIPDFLHVRVRKPA